MSYFEIEFNKTYKTEETAKKALENFFEKHEYAREVRHTIIPTKDGRFGIVFVGQRAVEKQLHFHWNVIA